MRVLFSFGILSCLMAGVLRADNLSATPCPADTSLASYQVDFSSSTVGAPNGPCSAGILNFYAFSFESFGNPVSNLLGSSQIFLNPISPPPGGEGATGFGISGMSVQSGQTATYVIDWLFDIDNGPYAGGASLGMDPPSGDVTITQDYCVDSYISTYIAGSAPSCYDAESGVDPAVQSLTVTTNDPTDTVVFNPVAYDFADVMTIIQLNGDEGPASFDEVEGTASVNPEPGTWLLISAGLLTLGLLRKRALTQ
jgi:hypothetical protein